MKLNWNLNSNYTSVAINSGVHNHADYTSNGVRDTHFGVTDSTNFAILIQIQRVRATV